MGAFLAVLAEVFDLASVTGLSVESILSGEALTTAELLQSHINNLVVYGGLTEAEALSAVEVTPQAFAALTSLFPNFPQALGALAATEFTATGALTVGAAVSAALYPYYWDYRTPVADLNMALQIWYPDLDILFPGVMPFARFVNYIDPANWATDLYRAVGRYFWERVQAAGENFLQESMQEAGRALAVRTATSVSETLAQFFENARWAVAGLSNSLYHGLGSYYSQLGLSPIQQRQLARSLGQEQPYRYDLYDKPQVKGQVSANYVTKVDPPGGANQRTAPDWMLPLLLGLYGDLTPSWKDTLEEIEAQEDGSHTQKAKRRKTKA